MYFFLIGEMKLKKKIEKNNINYSNTDLETYVERLTVFYH
jgi:hypothetical protein